MSAVNVSGAWKSATSWINVSGVWKQATEWVNVNGVWKQSGSTSSGGGGSEQLTPSYVTGYGRSPSTITVTTTAATVNNAPAGATFVWHTSNSNWSAISPSSSSTQFRAQLIPPGEESSALIYCTVTANGNSYNTNTIQGEATNTYAV